MILVSNFSVESKFFSKYRRLPPFPSPDHNIIHTTHIFSIILVGKGYNRTNWAFLALRLCGLRGVF